MMPHTSTCAACFLWHWFQSTRLPCGHQPNDTRPAACDVCRFYLEDLDERSGRPRRLECGQPAAAPILWGACGCCHRAGRTHGSLDLLFCRHTMERPGRNCLSCRARGDLLGAESRTHMLHTRHFRGGAAAANRSWSPPNKYDVMAGNFGPMDDSLEAELREDWLDAVERVTGFDPRRLRRHDFDRNRRPSRAVEHGGRLGDPEDGPGQVRALRSPRHGGQGEPWVRDTHPRFGDRDGRGVGGTARPGLPGEGKSAAGALGDNADRPPAASGRPRDDGGSATGEPGMDRYLHGGSRYGEGQAPSRGMGADDGGHMPLDAAGTGRNGGYDADGTETTTEEVGRQRTVDVLPVCAPDRAPTETGP